MGIIFLKLNVATVSFPFSHNHYRPLFLIIYYCCILIYIACPQPTPKSGTVMAIIQISQRNDPITFKCKDGYWPNGEFSTLCLQNGTWTIDPNDVCSGWNVRSEYKGCMGFWYLKFI